MINAKNCAMQHKKIDIQRADPVLQGRLLVYVGLWPWGVPSVQAARHLDRSLSRDQLAGKYVVRA